MSRRDSSLPGSAADRDSSPDFAALRTRASRRRLATVGVVLAALAAAAGVALVSAQRTARAELEGAVGALRTCLLGGPLDANESTSLRFRRLQIRAVARADAERASTAHWPFSCRAGAGAVLGMLKKKVPEGDEKALAALVALLADGGALVKDGSATVDAAVRTLNSVYTAPIAAGTEPVPPAARNADSLTKIAGLSKKGLSRSHTEENPGLGLPILIEEDDAAAPLLCMFRAGAADAECRSLGELAAVSGHGLRLLATSDPEAPTLIFAGKRGTEGVFAAGSPSPIDRMYSFGGYSSRTGSLSVLGWNETGRNMVLTQRQGTQTPVRTPLNPNFRVGNFFYGSQLLWEHVFIRGITPNEERRLFMLPLAQKDKSSFELVDIGELPEAGLIRAGEEEQPHITGCRTEKVTVIRVQGVNNDYLTFRINGAFSQPVRASDHGVLSCHGTTASIVRVQHAGGGSTRVYHETCTSAGCVPIVLGGEALDRDSSELRPREHGDLAAVDLEGKLLVVWLAGEHGGLRMRLATPDTFARTVDTVVFDDLVWEGKVTRDSTVLGFRLYSRQGFAVLLLSSLAGLHAFRIDPDGQVQPWSLKLQR